MDKTKLEHYKKLLIQHRLKIMNGGIISKADDLYVSQDDLADEGDLAATVVNQQVSFTMRQREMSTLHAIDEALSRIEDGTYGLCEDCDDPIGAKRLENQPWSTLCITHAEEREREEARFKKSA